MKYILAIDQGTSSSRCILYDKAAQPIAVAQQEFKQIYPQPGWVEHDAEEIWQSQANVIKQVMQEKHLKPSDIAGIGITNQRETTVIWDRKTGTPIHNAIVWQDRRTADECYRLRDAGHEPLIQAKTGLLLDAYFSATKIKWLLDNVEGARERAEAGELAFGTVDSWLIWKLTNGILHITDVSNASRTMLFNINHLAWDDELLNIFSIPKSVLPEVRSSSEVYGEIETPNELKGIKIAGIAGDQQAALFGQLCFDVGATKNTYGTGCFMLQNIGDKPIESKNRLLTTIGWQIGEKVEYALEGSVFIGGAVIQWLRDALGIIEKSVDVEPLAASVPDNGGVYFVPAFAGLGTPHWNQEARGMIVGLTRGTGKAHIARAALESIAFQTADLLDAMQADSGAKLSELRVDGGATANNLLMQIQADILQIPVVRSKTAETTALGAAYLVGLAVRFWKSKEDLAEHWQADKRFEPQISADAAAGLRAKWNEAVGRSMNWTK